MHVEQQPHRPGPLHQTNKAYKGGRHSRKSSATTEIKTKSISKPGPQLAREDRLNQATQSRKLRRKRVLEEKRKLGLESYPPLVVGVLDLYKNLSQSFINSIKNYDDKSVLSVKEISDRATYIISTRLKMRFKFVALDASNFDETLDLVKSLDLLLLIHHPSSVEDDFQFSDSQLFKSIYIHCLPAIVHVLDGTKEVKSNPSNSKRIMTAKKSLRALIKEEKIHSVEKDQDFLQLFHILGNCKRQKSLFKDARPTVVTDKVEIIGNSLAISGFVMKRVLSPNDLVHVVGYGDYQIEKIDILPDVIALRPASLEGSQVVQTLMPDPMKQETLEQENDIDPMEGEQTWPTAEELAAEAERRNTRKIIKKLPPGTSAYQGAWIPEDSDEGEEVSESSDDDGDTHMKEITEEGEEGSTEDEDQDQDEIESVQEDGASEMDIDDYDKNNSNEKEMKILEKMREARLDEMFPDEIDTPADIPARLRFARYRGLKSFRTSHWDPQENLPPDYSRIFQFQNFHQTKRRVLNERTKDGADPGQYVRVYLSNVPNEVITHILSQPIPPSLIGLLKYERKMTVMNILIKRTQDSNLKNPIRSKEDLIFYVGFRKFKAKPLFTTHSASSKFKYERFLRDDVAMVATIYAPITFPPAPVLVFRQNNQCDKELVASGSVMDSNPSRLIIKRIRLSGHPFKIHSKSAVIRFMFFNSEDVTYFKPVELTTKYNRRGHISEALGTHGHMKCLFDRKIRSDDCVFMNLYKRVFPKWTYSPITLI